ncbi:hypothetical protein DOY81_008079 [Sarcophaga bullata]|nr:hypothetical protein DOY81_008079 [Sarcophaga bullata]
MKRIEIDVKGDQRIMSLKQKVIHPRGKDLGNGVNTCPYKRYTEREDKLERKIQSVVSLKENAKHFKDTGFDKENNNREQKHQLYESKSRICQKTDHQNYKNGHRRYQNGEASTITLKEKGKQIKDKRSHSPEAKHQNGRERDETNTDLGSEDEVIACLKEKAKQRRGRGFGNEINNREGVHRMSPAPACHEYDNADAASHPQRSAEGWILFVTNISDEADEDDIQDKFCDYGPIMNLSMNVDRRTGFCKGYALVLFETYEDASSAKDALDGAEIMGQPIKVDWCFVKGTQRVQKLSENKRR